MKFYYIPLQQGESLTHRDWQVNSEVRTSRLLPHITHKF